MEGGDAGMNGIAGKEKGLIIKGKGKEMTVPCVEPGAREGEREDYKWWVYTFLLPCRRIHAFINRFAEISSSRSRSRLLPLDLRFPQSPCRASFGSPIALEHLQDFIYYAYSFYTGLQEPTDLLSKRVIRGTGDLAKY